MNKSEREDLAVVVSQMRTSFESSPEVRYWSDTLLSLFPSISSIVDQYDEVQRIENVVSCYIHYIVKMSCTFSMSSKKDKNLNNIGRQGSGPLYDIFDDYFCHENTITLEDLEDNFGGDEIVGRGQVKELFSDELFIKIIEESQDLTEEQKNLYKGLYLIGDWG